MDKSQAVFNFWNTFDLPVYDEQTVPTGSEKPPMPYLTYSTVLDSEGNVVQLNASLWYRSTSWAAISKKAEEISKRITAGGTVIKIDGGYVWLCRGTPFAQRMADTSDPDIRRIYINVQAEYLTAD